LAKFSQVIVGLLTDKQIN